MAEIGASWPENTNDDDGEQRGAPARPTAIPQSLARQRAARLARRAAWAAPSGGTPARRRRRVAGLFPVAAPAISYPRASGTDLTATWIGHSTVLLQLGGLNVLTDPVFSQRAFPVQWLGPRRVMDPGARDRCAPAARRGPALPQPLRSSRPARREADRASAPGRRRGSCRSASAHTSARWGAREIVELDWWQADRRRRRSDHRRRRRGISAPGPRRSQPDALVRIRVRGRRQARVSSPATRRITRSSATSARGCGPFDLVMIPIGAYDPRWFMQRGARGPGRSGAGLPGPESPRIRERPCPLMLGIHWGTFRLTDEPMDEPPRRTAAAWREAGLPTDRLWIARFGETRGP